MRDMDLKKLSEPITPDDVEFRVKWGNNQKALLLAYKDSRCDVRRLNEVVGPENWKCEFAEIRGSIFCTVSIKIDGEWVSKQDSGEEASGARGIKGESSDALKRACFRWGIGIELYDYPQIWIDVRRDEVVKGKPAPKLFLWKCYHEFTDGKLSFLALKDERGAIRYKYGEMMEKK